MYLKQFARNLLTNKPIIPLNTMRRNFLTYFKSFNNINSSPSQLVLKNKIFSRNFFSSSNKEEKKDTKTEEEAQKPENEKKEDESDKALNEKYKELKILYNEQEQKLDQVKKKFHEIKDLYLKNVEEIDAIKLRTDREIKNTKDYAITKFAKDLLDVHDNFTRALGVISEKNFTNLSEEEKIETFNCFVEGIEMTQKGLLNTLKKHGIHLYDPKNEKFDPNKHEAVFDYEDDTLPPGTVGQVMQTGFSIGERVLRPAKVGVIKKK